jgi:hypothetical protein
MKTPMQAFRNFIENDMMQKTYTKEQIISLIDMLLIEREKEHILLAYDIGSQKGYNLAKIDDLEIDATMKTPIQYYNEKYSEL